MNEQTLRRDFRTLLIIAGLYALGISLSNTFVNIFIWKQYNDLLVLGYYNAIVFLAQLISTVFAGKVAKSKDRVLVLRLGVVFYTFFYVAVLLTKNWPVEKIILLGILLGVGGGFYWLSFNLLCFEITSPETRDRFNGMVGMLASGGTLIGPMTSALIINKFNQNGYYYVFVLSLSLFVVASVFSIFLHRRKRMGKFDLNVARQTSKKIKPFRLITWANFFQGLREGVFAFAITTYIFMVTNNELAIGKYMLINSILSIVFYYIVSKYVKVKNRKWSILIGAFFLFVSLFLLLGDISYWNFIVYSIVIAIMYPFLLVPFQSLSYDIIGKLPNLVEYRLEYIVWKQLYLNSGRLIAVIFYLIILASFPLKLAISIILLTLGSGHSIIYFLVKKL